LLIGVFFGKSVSVVATMLTYFLFDSTNLHRKTRPVIGSFSRRVGIFSFVLEKDQIRWAFGKKRHGKAIDEIFKRKKREFNLEA
jgi:hypothetical protein